ncbi:MarR family winged helix-turn-helix transcriptional regulator [Streptosporangium lutulentum]
MVHEETSEDTFFRELGGVCADLRQAFARHVGMSPHRVQVLIRLRRNGETSHSDLRQALGIDGASVTRLVKEFEAEGLVRRRLDPTDNRYTLAALTPAASGWRQTWSDRTRRTRSGCSPAPPRNSRRSCWTSYGASART